MNSTEYKKLVAKIIKRIRYFEGGVIRRDIKYNGISESVKYQIDISAEFNYDGY